MTYAALHCHDSLSILDGYSHPIDHVRRAKELGLTAIAETNHGSLSGAMKFWKAGKELDQKVILGVEAYLAPGDAAERQRGNWGELEGKIVPGYATHLTILAQNAEGLRNLYKLQEDAHLRGFYQHPRVDLSSLERYAGGLIVLSGCVGGAVPTLLRLGKYEEAKETAWNFARIFPGRYYLEMMANGLEFEEQLNRQLSQLAGDLGLPVVATGDSHYPAPGDAQIHACLLCVQTQSTLSDPKRFKFGNDNFYIKSYEEMKEAFSEYPMALENTNRIAEMIGSYDEMFQHQNLMPEGDPDELRMLVYEWLDGRDDPDGIEHQRAYYELDIIEELQYSGYFMELAADVAFAKRKGILMGNGRGSGGASIVAYALGITNINPLPHGLLFERFLNKERKSPPDVDSDMTSAGRDLVIQNAIDRNGADRTARILTLGTIATKRAILDSAKVLGLEAAQANKIKVLVPPPKRGRTLALEDVNGLEKAYPEVYKVAMGLDGQYRNTGIHAGGLVISPVPLSDVIPVKQGPNDPGLITGLTMGEVEELGLTKFDYLGVTTLDVVQQTLNSIGWSHDKLHSLELDDQKSYDLLRQGKTLGIFQLGESWAKGIIRDVKPDCFDDIVALVALLRPGSLDNGTPKEFARRKFTKEDMPDVHPEVNLDFQPLLKRSYGLPLYQEDALAIIKETTGWGYGQADLLFRAFGKKDLEKLAKAKPDFFSASKYSHAATERIWALLEPFADYGFGRAHSVGYAFTTYWTMFLKAHHPREFIAALLTHVDGKNAAEKLRRTLDYIKEANREGIRVLPPDVNESQEGFTPTSAGIRHGLGAIKGIGPAVVQDLLSKRPFASLDDLIRRTSSSVLSSRVLTALVGSGSLDNLWGNRESALAENESILELARLQMAIRDEGQLALVPVRYEPNTKHSVDWVKRGELERELLGLQLTYPQIMLKVPGTLSRSESEWVNTVLSSREPESEVFMESGGFRVALPIRSSVRGLECALGKLGIQVEVI